MHCGIRGRVTVCGWQTDGVGGGIPRPGDNMRLSNLSSDFRWSISFLYGAVVLALSVWPGRDMPDWEMPPGFDKAVHFMMYGMFAMLLGWASGDSRGKGLVLPACIAAFCAVYGLALESLQGSLEFLQRSRSAWDSVANVLGSAVFLGARRMILSWMRWS